MIHFIRLTRPLNLIIIVLTMYGLGWYFNGAQPYSFKYGVASLDYFLLVLSTTIIAAAGNIINDYFDVRADRINKPHRLIIGRFVKRRVAIVTHWGLNFIAFGIAIYLSWRLETFWYVFIHLLSINILWFYSSYFKRKFLIGNMLIAGLTAMVPMLVGLYFFQSQELMETGVEKHFIYPFTHFTDKAFVVFLSIALAGFAFILNFAREIVKDMEDIDGDKLLKAKTAPIVMGRLNSKVLTFVILMVSILTVGFINWAVPTLDLKALAPILLSGFLVFVALFFLLNAKTKHDYRPVNAFIKLAMVSGLLSPVYWKLIIIYG